MAALKGVTPILSRSSGRVGFGNSQPQNEHRKYPPAQPMPASASDAVGVDPSLRLTQNVDEFC
jgi:hypothetical protein